MPSIELSKLASRKNSKKSGKNEKELLIEVKENLQRELDIIILRDEK